MQIRVTQGDGGEVHEDTEQLPRHSKGDIIQFVQLFLAFKILTYNWLCPNVDLVCRMISEGDL